MKEFEEFDERDEPEVPERTLPRLLEAAALLPREPVDGQRRRYDPDDLARQPPDCFAGARSFAANTEAAEYGRRTWDEPIARLPAEQLAALRDYSSEPGGTGRITYREINGFLRGAPHPRDSYPEADVDRILERVSRIDRALAAHPLPEDLIVIREANETIFNDRMEKLTGRRQGDAAYMSTSLGPVATFNSSKPVLLRLHVPEGTPAIYMEGVSVYPRERELLLGRGRFYRVDKAKESLRDGRWHVFATVVA